jgi:hypothetical protein
MVGGEMTLLNSSNNQTEYAGYIWDSTHGTRLIGDMLQSEGLDTTGWTFNSIDAISEDGNTLAGQGDLNGVPEEWIATLPEPASAIGGVVFLAVVTSSRRRSNRQCE